VLLTGVGAVLVLWSRAYGFASLWSVFSVDVLVLGLLLRCYFSVGDDLRGFAE
jgi:hypothetical protein